MAEATATRPARVRASRAVKATPAAAPKAAPVAVAETDSTGTVNRIVLTLVHVGDTKTYSKWQPPEGSGCVGAFYAPLGTKSVKVAVSGAEE